MSGQTATQNILSQTEAAGNSKYFESSSQIEEQLAQLRRRRSALSGEIAAAETNLASDNSSLALLGGAQQLDAAAHSKSKVVALQEARALLDEQIAAKEIELKESLAAERWEAAVEGMAPYVNAAAKAVRCYEEHAEAVNRVLAEHLPEMATAYRDWERARKQFVDAVRALIPGVTPRQNHVGYPTTSPEAELAANRLLQGLESRCDNVRPALAPLAGLPLCCDLKSYQIGLQEPYGSAAHVLAQNLVATQKKEEEKRK